MADEPISQDPLTQVQVARIIADRDKVVHLPHPAREVPPPQPFDTQARYIICWVAEHGPSTGLVECNSFHHLCCVLGDTYPNEGDRVRGMLLHPGNWVNHPDDDLPFTTNAIYQDEFEAYVVSIFRVKGLGS